MDDKWFIYADGPDEEGKACVHFYRSWAGTKVAEVGLSVHRNEKERAERDVKIRGLVWELIEDSDRIKQEKETEILGRFVGGFWALDYL